METRSLLRRGTTSNEFNQRYAPDLFHDQTGRFIATGASSVDELEDMLYAEDEYDGSVVADDTGFELISGRVGTHLAYPFTLRALHALARETDDEA